ncbi:hypothetical protein KVP09_00885 [Alcaligenaceae bacterium CGII-47]|nr:hypothetical protein [Alcaligenaceae bacterium CGII-47]
MPKATVMRTRLSLLFVFCFLCQPVTGTTTPWPATPSHTSLQTPYGVLEVHGSDYVYESYLLFNGKRLEPDIQGIINITYAYQVGKARVILIAVDTGDSTCAISYRWMTIRQDGYRLTAPFGSCSASIRVTIHGKQFVLNTPNPDKVNAIDTWIFDGRTVRRR